MQLNWRPMAMDDLDSVVDYIAQDNPRAAIDVGDAIVDQVGQLATHPNLGRPGRIEGTRELVISRLPYVVPYRVTDTEVEILRVYHTAQRWPSRLDELQAGEVK